MRRRVIDILACPVDKHHPLDLHEFATSGDTIEQGMLVCTKCARYFPIIDEIPIMLPDDMRKEVEDIEFLKNWQQKIPEQILKSGKPFHI